MPLDKMLAETDNPSAYSWSVNKGSDDGMPELLLDVINKISDVKKYP